MPELRDFRVVLEEGQSAPRPGEWCRIGDQLYLVRDASDVHSLCVRLRASPLGWLHRAFTRLLMLDVEHFQILA